ncbi:unnamed protein product [Acanthoscelides obtectus]|uniref:Ferritin n=1 Tax=Acanthoscelides obtectus TaxID=200917 RepID=A0A9P0KUW1_ACAOB|nr:unnamed protein product [Acanthoscelides obtectus]CAK1641922.1 Ferritin heavy chain [Acanthoscelides obtectus]
MYHIIFGQLINSVCAKKGRVLVSNQIKKYLSLDRPNYSQKLVKHLFLPQSADIQKKCYNYAKKLLSTNRLNHQREGKSSKVHGGDAPGRHQFPKEVEDACNGQAMDEFSAAFTYLSMSCYFGRSHVALPGCQGYFMDMFEEELKHAVIFTNYILLRGGQVKLCCVQVSEEHDWMSVKNAFNAALDLEKSVKENESIKQLARLVTKAQMTDTKVGEHLFDQMMHSTFVKKSNMMYKKSIEGDPEAKDINKRQ